MIPSLRLPRLSLLRSATLPAVVIAGLLLITLVTLLVATSHNLARFDPLQKHQLVTRRVHDQILALQLLSLEGLDPATPVTRDMLAGLTRAITALSDDPSLLSKSAPHLIIQAGDTLTSATFSPGEALQRSAALLQQALNAENLAHTDLILSLQAQARLERDLAAITLVAIPLAAVLTLFLLRRHFLGPLRDLNDLLLRLANRDFAAARVEDADPLLAPLIANYNHMVGRLAQLEAEHQEREDILEARVRDATHELLVHNRSLAEADRLAAVGEMAASLAHELRNPLAGVQMALANLRHETTDEDARERLDLAIGELRRVNDLMNDLLNQARLTPEEATPVDVAHMVSGLLALVRYQSDPAIRFVQDTPEASACLLPENRLRQALLNLVLNAAQAMPGGGEVRISARRKGERLELTVSDQGPGFAESILQQGPRRFASHRPGGSGLGLASVRRLAQDLGGELKLENAEAGGARVTLALPCITVGMEEP